MEEELKLTRDLLGGLAKFYARSINSEFVKFMKGKTEKVYDKDDDYSDDYLFIEVMEDAENPDKERISQKKTFYRKLHLLNEGIINCVDGMKAIDYLSVKKEDVL